MEKDDNLPVHKTSWGRDRNSLNLSSSCIQRCLARHTYWATPIRSQTVPLTPGGRSAPENRNSVSQFSTVLFSRSGKLCWAVCQGFLLMHPQNKITFTYLLFNNMGFPTTDLELKLSSWIAWKYCRFTRMHSSYPETWIWVINSD